MPGIARVTADAAGGAQLGGGQSFVSVDGLLVVLLGDPVAGHGDNEHAAPVMVEGSAFVTVGGVPVCIEGNSASCGHPTTGSAWVQASG